MISGRKSTGFGLKGRVLHVIGALAAMLFAYAPSHAASVRGVDIGDDEVVIRFDGAGGKA